LRQNAISHQDLQDPLLLPSTFNMSTRIHLRKSAKHVVIILYLAHLQARKTSQQFFVKSHMFRRKYRRGF